MTDNSTETVIPEITGQDVETSDDSAQQFVAFTVGDQSYCVDIMSVREIRAWTGTTTLPNTAQYVRGVVNLRGVIVPIIDLRTRFGQGMTDPTKAHVVVIVAIEGKLNGLLVDGVSDILTIREADIMPIPEAGGEQENPYLDGLITQEEQMVALIALDRLIEHAVVH